MTAQQTARAMIEAGDEEAVARLVEALEQIERFVINYRLPWGAWKTAWWEDEVSDDAAFTTDNALMHVVNIANRATLPTAKEG